MKVDKNNIHLFWYWVYERQNIYYRKNVLNQEQPWTEDQILRDYKFTNVHRSLDRTTIYYHDTIGKYKDHKDIIFGTFIHRIFNNIATMDMIMHLTKIKTFDDAEMFKILDDARKSGKSIYTNAHMTTGVRFHDSPDKLDNIVFLLKKIHAQINQICDSLKSSTSLEELYWNTRNVNGFGPFLAYQYILDMVNTGVSKFSLDDFSVAGPGCKRGLRHIFPEINDFLDGMKYLRDTQHKYFDKYGYDYLYLDELGGKEAGIHLGDIENCCCEFSKYFKSYHGIGRPRNRYLPASIQAKRQIEMFK